MKWWINPWAEVRRLRSELKWRDHMRLDMAKAWRDERRENYQRIREANALKDENADLRQRIAEMEEASEQTGELCGCQRCTYARPGMAGPGKAGWRYACKKCGNKRCPHHDWHGFKCTGSNEPDQIGEEE